MFWGLGKNLLGIDISSISVKIVQLKHHRGRKPTLITYAASPLPYFIIQSDSTIDHQKIANIIKETLKKARVSTKKTVATLPGYSAFIYVIKVPKLSRKDLPEAVKWEAKKSLPVPLDEIQLDWKILQKLESSGEKKEQIEVLFVAAPKNTINKYTQILHLAGIELVSLEIEPLALARALADPQSTVLIIDIGANSTQIIIVDQGIVRLVRDVSIGGIAMTKAISINLGVDRKTAEEFKKDFGIDESKLEGRVFQAIAPIVDTITAETKRCLDVYKGKKGDGVKKIILSGGPANLPELSTYLARTFNLEVQIGNPWSQTNYPPQFSEKIESLGPSFAVCIGAGLKEI
jgi:type IV pilus assembly protein PilM